MDSKCEPTNQGRHIWDHELLDKELEKLDAEIKETKSRMASKLFLTHPPLADTSSIASPLSNSPRYSGNVSSFMEDDGGVSAAQVHATTENHLGVLPSASTKTERLRHAACASSELKTASLDEKLRREAVDFTSAAEKICLGSEKDSRNDVKLKVEEGETASTNHMGDSCKTDRGELLSQAAADSKILSETTLCVNTKWQSDSTIEASSTYPSVVRRVEVSQVAAEPSSAGDLTILFKKDVDTNQNVLVDIITETLMQELLDYELSDMVLRGRASSPCMKDVLQGHALSPHMKDVFSVSTSVSRETHILHHPLSDTSNPSAFTSLVVPSQEVLETRVTGSSYVYEDYQKYEIYYNSTTENSAIGSPEIFRESFKHTSKRLVDKYVEENLEAPGLLCSSSLLELYASGKTTSLVLGKVCVDGGEEREEQLYGKMIMEAIFECLDKSYMQFCLPSYFLFFLPCPEGAHLKKMLINKVNEHADAACEGGFSLEYILEKSLDEEDWKTPYHEMMEVLHNIAESVMVDMIENFLYDVMEAKQLACASQAALGLTHTPTSMALLC